MPTYEYHCTACGHQWEMQQSIKADPEHSCPKCHKHKAQRGIGTGMAILVGGSGGGTGADDRRNETKTAVANAKDHKPPAADPTKKPTPATATATGAQVEGNNVGAPASAAPPVHEPGAGASSGSAPKAEGEEGKSNATHPAREGRGFGNIKDSFNRQRREGGHKFGSGFSKGQGSGKSFGAPRKGGSRGR